MENTYLVCFDFNRLWEQYILNEKFYPDIAEDFLQECIWLKDKLIKLFPNFTIPLSNNSFLIKTHFKSDDLLDILIKELADYPNAIKDGDNIKRQIYVAEISNLKSYTYRTKQLEIEYLTNANCKHK